MVTRLFLGLIAVMLTFAVQPVLGDRHVAPAQPVAAAQLPFQTEMFGSNQVPAVRTLAWGFVRFFFNDAKTEADYTVDVKGLSGTLIAGADIHRAQRGSNGPAIHHLADGNFIVTSGRMKFSAADLNDISAGNWYVSLKTHEHPNGELRGQIQLPEGFWTPTNSAPLAAIPVVPLVTQVPEPLAAMPLQPAGQFGALLAEPSTACYGDYASVNFRWSPLPASFSQWLDLSYYDDAFSPGSFYSLGPLLDYERGVTWDLVPAGFPFYWRINTLTPLGWVASSAGAYSPCYSP